LGEGLVVGLSSCCMVELLYPLLKKMLMDLNFTFT
jgi:hypothetical protein